MKKIEKLSIYLTVLFFASNGIIYPQAATVTDSSSKVGQTAGPHSPPTPRLVPDASAIRADLNPYNIAVPEEAGKIEEVFQGTPGSPLIVYIQNVHANYDAQMNIKHILNHLVEKSDISLIQLEGAVSKLDPAVLQPSYLREANLKLVDMLMREGRITGADAFAVETDKPVELYGIEDYSLYMENVKMFRAVYKHQEEIGAYFNEVHRLIQNIGPKLFSPELLDFTRKTEEFSTDRIDLLDYLVYMNKLSEKNKLISLSDLKEMVQYPNLVRIIRLERIERELNKNGLKKEIEALKLEFQKKMPESEKVHELLSRLEGSAKGINPRSYFLELTRLADEAKIDFMNYPAFRIYAEFLIHQDEIDHRELFSELKRFENYLQEKLFLAPDEKAFLEIIAFVGLLEQYFRLEMSREKMILYLKDQDKIKPSWIAARLEELAQKYEVQKKSFGDLKQLDSYLEELEYFYRLVLKRDKVFVEKVFAQMKLLKQDKTILVTGGFHKEGLMDHFRKENISYVIVSPKINVEEGSEKYLKVMLEENTAIGSVFTGTFSVENPRITNPDQRLELGEAYSAGGVWTHHLTSIDYSREQMNRRLAELAPSAGLFVAIRSSEINSVMASQRSELRFYDVGGAPRKAELATELVRKSGDFSVRVTDFRSASRRQLEGKGVHLPREKVVPINRAKVPVLAQIVILDQERPTVPVATPDQFFDFSFLLGSLFVPFVSVSLPDNLASLTFKLQGLSPQEVRSFHQALEAGVAPEVAFERVQTESRMEPITDDAIEKAGLQDEVRKRHLKFFSTSNSAEPSVLVVPILAREEATTQLRYVFNAVTDHGTAAVVYGKGVSQLAASWEAKPEILERIQFVDVDEKLTEKGILEQMVRDLQSARHTYRLYQKFVLPFTEEPPFPASQFMSQGYVRVLIPEEDPTISLVQKEVRLSKAISGISPNIPQLRSALKRPKVIQGGFAEAFAAMEIEVLRRLPRQGEAEKFLKLLQNYELTEIITGEGSQWGIAVGVEALVGQLYADYMAAVRTWVAA